MAARRERDGMNGRRRDNDERADAFVSLGGMGRTVLAILGFLLPLLSIAA